MGQQSILTWLAHMRRTDQSMVFRVTDIANGTGMNMSNCSKAIKSLARSGMIEEVFLKNERTYRYRISQDSYEKILGERLETPAGAIQGEI